ncbi:nickel/cobalt transporter, partial [Achromobacter xylosoxidans]
MRVVLALLAVLLLGGAAAAAAQGAHPFGVPEGGASVGGPGWLAGFFGKVSVWQSYFYRQLTGAVRAWQAEGGAAWALIGLSFAYGVFHALGPGHGKAVISSYVLANRQTARNGALLALASALIQALVAIALVAVLALIFNATAATMNNATRWLELGSYALVTLLGMWLVWVKAIRPLLRTRAGPAPAESMLDHGHGHEHSHHQHHDHDCGCGHAHVPAPAQVSGPLNWRRAATAILAVGLRPCSGALIVLVFALAQGFFLAGVASALAMGLGTGLTVAALACLAVAAGGAATRIGSRLSSAGAA